jgi:hypothetical protein
MTDAVYLQHSSSDQTAKKTADGEILLHCNRPDMLLKAQLVNSTEPNAATSADFGGCFDNHSRY